MELSTFEAFHPRSFIFELPLYTSLVATLESQHFDFLMNYNEKIEGYSISLKGPTTYVITNNRRSSYQYPTRADDFLGLSTFTLTCLRSQELVVVYVFSDQNEIENDKGGCDIFYRIQKIGQFPSIADLHLARIKTYAKVLDKEKLKEFTRAIGLSAHGIGIGSFVYLRRIIEYLIEEAHIKARSDTGWEEEDYRNMRIGERIQALKNHLPNFLIKNKEVYSIISKGIHELNEDECLQHFEIMKVAIELILDEKVEERNKEEKKKLAEKAISNLASKL
jgi:hypothetical protein